MLIKSIYSKKFLGNSPKKATLNCILLIDSICFLNLSKKKFSLDKILIDLIAEKLSEIN